MRSLFRILGSIITLIGFWGCNPYSTMDKPSGDLQILAAARACFDQGDYSCASKYYGQLSSASSDTATSESTFMLLSQNGATMGRFINSVVSGSDSAGKLITKLAGTLTTEASEASRLAYFHAYQTTPQIKDIRLQGLVEFISSIFLLSEIFAEDAGTPGKLKKTDLVIDATQCAETAPLGCNPPDNKKIVTGSQIGTGDSPRLLNATDSQLSGAPTLYMIDATIKALKSALDKLNTTGSLGSNSSSFSDAVLNNSGTALQVEPGLYRSILIKNGIGE